MEFEKTVAINELEEGIPYGVVLADGEQVCVVRVGGTVHAMQDRCSHADFPMSDGEMVDDHVIECPLHGAQFDVRDGQVLEAPADEPLVTYEVRVDQGVVWLRRPA
jgi:nitrite reductase/ring-hydroxylating ferredoxin subunit